jgi:hypothetical protein
MLAFCLIATYQCVKQAKKTNRKLEIYAFAMAMFSFSVSFAHDYIQRVGLINDNVLLTQISFLTFFFVIAVIAVLDNERSQMAITMNNVLAGNSFEQSVQTASVRIPDTDQA